jgi:hypothetical protein
MGLNAISDDIAFANVYLHLCWLLWVIPHKKVNSCATRFFSLKGFPDTGT